MEKIKKFDEYCGTEANGASFYGYLEYIGGILISKELNIVELYEVLTGLKFDGEKKLIENSVSLIGDEEEAEDKVFQKMELIEIADEKEEEEKKSGCFGGLWKRICGEKKKKKKKFWSGWFQKKVKIGEFKETEV